MDSIPDQPDYSSLRSNVSCLGRLLGETIAAAEGPPLLELIERIRRLSKAAREGEADALGDLLHRQAEHGRAEERDQAKDGEPGNSHFSSSLSPAD